jgi:hypothetical protein
VKLFRIALPERCANVAFGGRSRGVQCDGGVSNNRLLMAAGLLGHVPTTAGGDGSPSTLACLLMEHGPVHTRGRYCVRVDWVQLYKLDE